MNGPVSSREAEEGISAGALIRWILDQQLLRGPHLFVDYWANVLELEGLIRADHLRNGFIDAKLFRAGLDRPGLEVPHLRFYLLLFLTGPLILLRSFRKLGRYRMRFFGPMAEEIQRALQAYRLTLTTARPGRVNAAIGETQITQDLINPYMVSGFCSPFWAAYKLPIASLSAILLVAIIAPILYRAGLLGLVADYWIPVGFPLLVLLLYAVFRDWITAILGALPVLVGRYLLTFVRPYDAEGWLPFFWPLAALFALYLLVDWFFLPRPVPPVLFLYTKDGPGKPYERADDAPYWLRGDAYWVWRYLILSPAELNKFWERDWERVDLWIRADGPEAGSLEWVVTDMHYRELWQPYENLGHPRTLERHREAAQATVNDRQPGIWLVEVDADLLVHYPFVRAVSFLPDRGGVPARDLMHLVRSLRSRIRDEPTAEDLLTIDRLRVSRGIDLLGDVPEFILPRVVRHLMTTPWRYWRFPFGAATRRAPRLYENRIPVARPAAADPALQIKAEPGDP